VKKKLFVRLKGGYGNQLFIYAFGMALAEKTGKELIIDNMSGFGSAADEYKSEYGLDGLGIKDKLIGQTIFKYFLANKYFWYLAKKINISHFEESSDKYKDVSKSKKQFFEGYWQSSLYFDDYREQLRKNLLVKKTDKISISNYKKRILESKNSVAIGMRFYEETMSASQHHMVKDDTYYCNAIELLEKRVSRPKYFVFSTDIKRAKKIIDSCGDKDVVYIDPIRAKDNAKYDLYLMSLCDHFIISNGTFYWWAAYLGEDKKSIVIAPGKGFVNVDAVPANWLKL
jgi:hypothetical protein